MRIHGIAVAAICVLAGCSSELKLRAPATDPTSVDAAEARFAPPPRYVADPLLQTPAERQRQRRGTEP